MLMLEIIVLPRAVESGLKYKYYSSWKHILRVLGVFYQVAGSMKQCQKFMSNVRTIHMEY